MLFRLFPVTSCYFGRIVFTFNFNAMRRAKKANPTLIEIIDYWLEQKKNNTGRMNIDHYMKVCHAKARTLRWNDNDKTWTQI